MPLSSSSRSSPLPRRTPSRSLSAWGALVLAGAALVAGVTACGSSSGGGGGGGSCTVATSCPSTTPSYKADVDPIIQSACVPCHGAGGPGGFDGTTYTQVYSYRSSMLDQVGSCSMPPVGEGTLTDAQRVTLTGWLECGAPDN